MRLKMNILVDHVDELSKEESFLWVEKQLLMEKLESSLVISTSPANAEQNINHDHEGDRASGATNYNMAVKSGDTIKPIPSQMVKDDAHNAKRRLDYDYQEEAGG